MTARDRYKTSLKETSYFVLHSRRDHDGREDSLTRPRVHQRPLVKPSAHLISKHDSHLRFHETELKSNWNEETTNIELRGKRPCHHSLTRSQDDSCAGSKSRFRRRAHTRASGSGGLRPQDPLPTYFVALTRISHCKNQL